MSNSSNSAVLTNACHLVLNPVVAVKASLALMLLTFTLWSSPTFTAEPMVTFETEQKAQIYAQLLKDHRCLKCQNQNLASSNASIAGDLRREIQEQVVAGHSRAEISDYLVQRYGDFVLYRPPFKATTYALWLGPFVLLVIALAYAVRLSRSSSSSRNATNESALEQARSILRTTDKSD